jgi:Undecaprenyl-phosphate galactose phosphotransferase WbaP
MSRSNLTSPLVGTAARPVMVDAPVPVARAGVVSAGEGAATPNGAVVVVTTPRRLARPGAFNPAGIVQRLRPSIMVGTLLIADAVALSAAFLAAVYGRWWLGGQYEPWLYLRLWPLVPLFLIAFACFRLYPSAPLSRPEELRRLCVVTTLLCLGLATVTFFTREGFTYSRIVLFASWAMALVTIPMARSLVRLVLARRPWWGIPVVVIGDGDAGQHILRTLQRQPELGLKPVAVLRRSSRRVRRVLGVPVLGTVGQVKRLSKKYRVSYAIVSMSDLPSEGTRGMLDAYARAFHHLMVVPDLSGLGSLWVQPVDLGGMLGLEIRHRLLDPWRRTLKRCLDLTLVVATAPVVATVMLLIAMAVRLDSAGPVFFRHERIGRGGRRFGAWKFRTMIPDADRVLQQYLDDHPELREEWEATQKLRDDPRITRVGRFLRRTSLDELPQVLNVLVGEMSLVGPRPIVDEELEKYGDHLDLYRQVLPGITGVWQTHGRNLLTYDERVEMDCYYVRNWSVWLDIWLLARTILPVLSRRGAY